MKIICWGGGFMALFFRHLPLKGANDEKSGFVWPASRGSPAARADAGLNDGTPFGSLEWRRLMSAATLRECLLQSEIYGREK
jgi:hypothetical protein